MLIIILSIIIIIPVLAGIGEIFQRLFGKIWSGVSAQLISGIFFLAMIWQVLAFFIPLNIWVESISLGIGILAFFYFKSYQNFTSFTKNEIFKILLLTIIVAFVGSYYPFILDHFGYYVPSVNWLHEFGLTKGLANLNLIYAQMSVWHIFQAGFSNILDVLLRINVVFLVIFCSIFLKKRLGVYFLFHLFFCFFFNLLVQIYQQLRFRSLF